MTRRFRSSFVLLLLGAASPALAQSSAPPCPPAALRYEVALERGAARVGVCVPGAGADSAVFELPQFGGVETLGDNVSEISATTPNGGALPVMRRGTGRWVVAAGGRAFRLAYTVRHAKIAFMGAEDGGQYHPTLMDGWALLWGHSYLLRPASDALLALPAAMRVDAGPYGAGFASWGADSVFAGVDSLRNTVFVAGDFRRLEREVEGVPVTFLAQGEWSFTDEAFADAVRRVLQAQVAAMGSYPTRRLAVILVPGHPDSGGGTVVKDAIVFYSRPGYDATRDPATLGLLAHEHFHLWNGVTARADPAVPEGELKWFSEGFTDYYADLTLLRAGVLDEAGLVERTNGRIREYLSNPHALTATAAVLGERYWESRDYTQLPYIKGALVGLLMDLRIRRQSGGARSLDDYVRAVFARGGSYGADDLRRLLEETSGRGWGDFLGAYVSGAGELPLLEVCAEAGMECAAEPDSVFDLGFEVDGRLRVGALVTAVDAGSPAERAGLRVGDALASFSMRYDLSAPGSVEVTRGGERLAFTYLPAREVTIPRIQPTAATLRVLAALRGGAARAR